jgi:hypothetical protein
MHAARTHLIELAITGTAATSDKPDTIAKHAIAIADAVLRRLEKEHDAGKKTKKAAKPPRASGGPNPGGGAKNPVWGE